MNFLKNPQKWISVSLLIRNDLLKSRGECTLDLCISSLKQSNFQNNTILWKIQYSHCQCLPTQSILFYDIDKNWNEDPLLLGRFRNFPSSSYIFL